MPSITLNLLNHCSRRSGESNVEQRDLYKPLKPILEFSHNATEAAIFFAWAQKQSRLASAGLAPNTSYLNRPKRFSTSHVFTELSSWLSSTEGVAANGLKGLFERFGIQGGLQKPTGGTGRFCGSCGGTIFKVRSGTELRNCLCD